MADEPIPFRPRVVLPVEIATPDVSVESGLTEEMSELWKNALLDALNDGGEKGGLVVFVDRAGLVGCNAAGWDVYKMIGTLTIALDACKRLAQGLGVDEKD